MTNSVGRLTLFLPILFSYFVLGTCAAGVVSRYEGTSGQLEDATIRPSPPLELPPIGRFNVSNSSTGQRCILATLGLQFNIEYVRKNGTTGLADLQLSPYADDSGTCDNGQGEAAIVLQWPYSSEGANYMLTLSFKKANNAFHLNDLVLNYNLTEGDFPDANETNAIKSVEMHDLTDTFSAPLGQSYKCQTQQTIQDGTVATFNFVGVQMQPFEVKGDVYDEPSVCSEDRSTTPFHSTPHHSTPPPTTKPPPPLPPPTVGHFNVTDTATGDLCLLARLGIQFKIQYASRDGDNDLADFQLSPYAEDSGTCDNGQGEASLIMQWPNNPDGPGPYTLTLVFAKVRDTFSLHGLVFTYNLTEEDFPDANDTNTVKTVTLNDLKDTFSAPVGQSYKCQTEQTIQDGNVATFNFIGVQLQPFEVKQDTFSPPRVCNLDITTPSPSPGPSTTAFMPLPIPGDWKITDGTGKVCMRVKASLQLKVKYYKSDGTLDVSDLTVPPHINATGNCAGSTGNSASLVLVWDEVYSVTIKFSKDIGTDSGSFRLNNIQVQYTINQDGFPDCRDCGTSFTPSNLTVNAYHGKVGNALKCTTRQGIPVDTNVTMTIAELEAQPFGIGQDGQFGETDTCPQDGPPAGHGGGINKVALGVCLSLFFVIAIGVTVFCYRKRRSQYQKF